MRIFYSNNNNVALAMTSCTKYKLHFGKACTPDNREWSYVWWIQLTKDGT